MQTMKLDYRYRKVVYAFPNNGSEHDHQQALKYLKPGKIYTVTALATGRFGSEVMLEEIPEIGFNAVLFADLDTYLREAIVGCQTILAKSLTSDSLFPEEDAITALLDILDNQYLVKVVNQMDKDGL